MARSSTWSARCTINVQETGHGSAESEISVGEMLAAKDRRASRQAAALRRFGMPVVSVSIVTPGPVKDTRHSRRALAVGQQEFGLVARAEKWRILFDETVMQQAGPEAIYSVEADDRSLKWRLVKLENSHPLGRLWDFDVITTHRGGLSRSDFGFPARACLICDRPARECGRSRRHPMRDLQNAVAALVDNYARLPA